MVNNPLEMLWKGVCEVLINEEVTDPITKRTSFNPTELYSNQSCKLSFETLRVTSEKSNAAEVTQITKLFISKDVTIPPGSKIMVSQNGTTQSYEMSGEPGIYTNHQEIVLNLFKGWS